MLQEIYKSLFNYFHNGYEYQMQNVYLFDYGWESDFFCKNREGYTFEMEVKVSRSDFRADFKKPKHKFLCGEDQTKQILPNKFYYVCPEGLLTLNDIPKYAGLIYSKNGHCTIMKRAPYIHKRKYDFRKKLCDKFYFKLMDERSKRIVNDIDIKNMREQIKNLKIHLNEFLPADQKWK